MRRNQSFATLSGNSVDSHPQRSGQNTPYHGTYDDEFRFKTVSLFSVVHSR